MPELVDGEPYFDVADRGWLEALRDLDTMRQVIVGPGGAVPGPIPFLAAADYFALLGYTGMDLLTCAEMICAVDVELRRLERAGRKKGKGRAAAASDGEPEAEERRSTPPVRARRIGRTNA